jgi:hypothetical protein
MEDEIQEKLQDKYNFPIDVKYRKTGFFDIYCSLKNDSFVIPVIYDKRRTLESNISNIIMKIDNQIIKLYKKEGF